MDIDNHPDSNLPEVVERDDLPIAVSRDEEGLQAVPGKWKHGQYNDNADKETIPQDSTEGHAGSNSKTKKSNRRWIILGIILAILIAIAVGLGAGLGIGLESGSNSR